MKNRLERIRLFLILAGFQATLVVFSGISKGGDVRQLEDDSVALYEGDCLQVLRCLPDASVHCCVTSPPYFGLRDYGMDTQIGLEETPDEYVDKLVAVFREVHRVLRDDGTLWVNLGDSYASSGGSGIQGRSGERADRRHTQTNLKYSAARFGLKPKDLIGIPWRQAGFSMLHEATGRFTISFLKIAMLCGANSTKAVISSTSMKKSIGS